MHIHRPVMITLACVLALSGCGKSADEQALEQAMEESTGKPASVDMSGNRVEITTEEGSINIDSGEGVAVPDSFPKDIHRYAGAKVTAAMSMPRGQMLTLQTPDAAAQVAESYQHAMSEAGWEREMAMDSPAGKMFSYTKEDRHVQVTIAAAGDGDGTMITVIAGSGE